MSATLTKGTTPGNGHSAAWSLTQANADGTPFSQVGAADRTIHVFGTWDGATVTIQGSNEDTDPTHWASLHDVSGSVAAFTSDGILLLAENPIHIRPLATGAGAATALSVKVVTRGAR